MRESSIIDISKHDVLMCATEPKWTKAVYCWVLISVVATISQLVYFALLNDLSSHIFCLSFFILLMLFISCSWFFTVHECLHIHFVDEPDRRLSHSVEFLNGLSYSSVALHSLLGIMLIYVTVGL